MSKKDEDAKQEAMEAPNVTVIKGSFDEWYEKKYGELLRSDIETARKAGDVHFFGIVKPSDRHKIKVLEWNKPVDVGTTRRSKKK